MAGVEMHIGEARERLERDTAERDAAADLAEHLCGTGVVACLGDVEQAGKHDRAIGIDGMRGEGGAAAQAPGAELAAAIEREVIIVDGGRGAAVVDMQRGLAIA